MVCLDRWVIFKPCRRWRPNNGGRGSPRHTRARVCRCVAGIVLAISTTVAARAQAPLPAGEAEAGLALPQGALFAATLDLRPNTPSVQTVLDTLRRQERAVGEAAIGLLGQIGLSSLGAEIDFEEDVLPWVAPRIHFVGLPPTEEGKPPRLFALVEVRDGARAAQVLEQVLPRIAARLKGQLFQRPVADSVLRHLAVPGTGHFQLALRSNALAISRDIGLVEAWLKAASAPQAPAKWARALRAVRPGLATVGLDATLLPKEKGSPLAGLGLGAAAFSVALSPEGARLEIAADFADASAGGPADQVLAYFSQASLREGALDAMPATALGAAALASPGGLLKAMGLEPLITASLNQALGQRADDVMPRLQPVLQRLLRSEMNVALMTTSPRPRWAGTLVAGIEEDWAASLPVLREAAALVRGTQVGEGVPDLPSFSLTLPRRRATVLLGAAGNRLFVASDAEALKWIAEGAQQTEKSLANSAAYRLVRGQLGANPSLEMFLDLKALGRNLSVLAQQGITKEIEAEVPQKYFTRLVDALLLPYPTAGLNLAVHDRMVVATLFEQVDWTAVSSAPATTAVVAAVAIPTLVRARQSARSRAEATKRP